MTKLVTVETTEKHIRPNVLFSCFGRSFVNKFIRRRKHVQKVFQWNWLAGTLTVDIDRVAKQANGAAFMHYGDTTVLYGYCIG